MELTFTFYAIAGGVIKLFIIMAIGYFLYARRMIDDKFVDMLSLLLVRVIFPAFIISKTVGHFSFEEYAYWWVLPLVAIGFAIGGMAIGAVTYRLVGNPGSRREFICCSSFQNCGYLPMSLILFSFSGEMANRLLIYMFLFIMGFNFIMWSLVPLFLSGKLKKDISLKVLLNPPVVATVISILCVALMGKDSIPPLFSHPISVLGQSALPLAMLALGAYLCRYRAYSPDSKMALGLSAGIKLLVIPVFVLVLLKLFPIAYDYKFFFFLQAIMPTAVSLVVIGSFTGADNKFISSNIFYTHLIAIFSIPLWLVVFKFFMG